MSAAEIQLDEQSSWFSSSEFQGALFGAALGGVTCALAGGNAATCVGSAVAVGALGYAAGAYMNSLRTNYSTQEAQMAKALSDIQADNQRIASYLATERQVIREKNARLNVIKQGLEQKTLTLSKVQGELDGLRARQEKLAKTANDLGAVENKWHETYAMMNIQDQRMEQQISAMQQRIQAVQQDNETLKSNLDDPIFTPTPVG